ncbi:hypothetical protein ES332_D05G301900v1 [Gossypium tomentosum]|uniref:Inositol polyphosphate-related phosphatase domain-containing protein n=1 Tax=Gossypium tomentosum TaxID=34277 RepID=A0A5D2L153_GOSTO|nr:hypothetical protein ES332_D05G301900v1 [Gossypium tomentosum]
MRQGLKQKQEIFRPGTVVRKLFNITPVEPDYGADSDDGDEIDSDSETQETLDRGNGTESTSRRDTEEGPHPDSNDDLPSLRRRKSETFRAQYINTKEIRICVGTWNVGGKVPSGDLDIDDWIDMNEPADMYVLGFQEIVPLNAGNIFGAEDSRPVPKWENIICDILNRIRTAFTKIKSYSDPSSPSKFKAFDDVPTIEEDIILESDSDIGEEIHILDEEPNGVDEANNGAKLDRPVVEHDLLRQYYSPKRLDRLNCLRMEDCGEYAKALMSKWPEPPLNLLSRRVSGRPKALKRTNIKRLEAIKFVQPDSTCKSINDNIASEIAVLEEVNLVSLISRKRRSSYVKIVSKQKVGIFLTIWVRRSLRRHIYNLKVSTVGVGVLGYIGNKGSVSVSMSIYQTLFCFICTHLTAGEKQGDELKRNADVHDILRRTLFHSYSTLGLPRGIHDHERIIWLGDLNYRINLSYDETCDLISNKKWSELIKRDQLVQELQKGGTFEGWSEGVLDFAPTYKYEVNSEKYYGEDPKIGRRTPSWCDRILSYGKGLRQQSYCRTELKISDHRPVTATYMAEVEVFDSRRLQRALTYTDAEIENEGDAAEGTQRLMSKPVR